MEVVHETTEVHAFSSAETSVLDTKLGNESCDPSKVSNVRFQ